MESSNTEGTAPNPGSRLKNARIAMSILARSTLAQLAALASNIIAALTGNAAFPNPNPTLAAIDAARQAFVAKMDLAAGGGKLATAQLGDARAELIRLLRELALDLQRTSGGDRTKLVSTGYPLCKERNTIGPLPPPSGLRLSRGGNTGQLIARCRSDRNARAWQWHYATAQTPTTWIDVGTTTRSHTVLNGLVPGTQYIVQGRVVGPHGASDWCDAVAMWAT